MTSLQEPEAPPGTCEICGNPDAPCLWPEGLRTCRRCRKDNPPIAQAIGRILMEAWD